jgi:hypothetical protein
MGSVRLPMNPLIQNALIVLAAGLISSLLCVKVYGAPLSTGDKNSGAGTPSQNATPAPASDNTFFQALLRPQGPIAGPIPEASGKR